MNRTLEGMLATGLAGALVLASAGCGRHEAEQAEKGMTTVKPAPKPSPTTKPEPTPRTIVIHDTLRYAPTPAVQEGISSYASHASPIPVSTEELEAKVGFSFTLYNSNNVPIAIPGTDGKTVELKAGTQIRYAVTESNDGAQAYISERPSFMIMYPEGRVLVEKGQLQKKGGFFLTRLFKGGHTKPLEFGVVLYHTKGEGINQKPFASATQKGSDHPIEVRPGDATEAYLYSITGDAAKQNRDQFRTEWLRDPQRYWYALIDVAGKDEAGYRLNIAHLSFPAPVVVPKLDLRQ